MLYIYVCIYILCSTNLSYLDLSALNIGYRDQTKREDLIENINRGGGGHPFVNFYISYRITEFNITNPPGISGKNLRQVLLNRLVKCCTHFCTHRYVLLDGQYLRLP